MSERNSTAEYRVAFTKLLWAIPLAHAAALLAVMQLIGNVPNPDFAFNALRGTIICLGIGGSLGLTAILFAQMNLMDDIMFDSRLEALKTCSDEERPVLKRKALRSSSSSSYMKFTATMLNFVSLFLLVWAGNMAFEAADNGRIQPRPGQVTEADVLSAVAEILAASTACPPAQPVPPPQPALPPAKAE